VLVADGFTEEISIIELIIDVKKILESWTSLGEWAPLSVFPFSILQILTLLLEEPLEEVDFIFSSIFCEATGKHFPQKHTNALELSMKKIKVNDMIKSSVTTFRIGTMAFLLNLLFIIKTIRSY
jgi:hypothetical protein